MECKITYILYENFSVLVVIGICVLYFYTVSECETSAMLPLECQYLNKNALTTLAGPLTPPVKHFQLKRKPKSATLRAELLQKCKYQTSGNYK